MSIVTPRTPPTPLSPVELQAILVELKLVPKGQRRLKQLQKRRIVQSSSTLATSPEVERRFNQALLVDARFLSSRNLLVSTVPLERLREHALLRCDAWYCCRGQVAHTLSRNVAQTIHQRSKARSLQNPKEGQEDPGTLGTLGVGAFWYRCDDTRSSCRKRCELSRASTSCASHHCSVL